MEKIYVIDKIESGIAICECMKTGEIIELTAKNRPKGAKEGDIIRLLPNDGFEIDHTLTTQRQKTLADRINRLFRR